MGKSVKTPQSLFRFITLNTMSPLKSLFVYQIAFELAMDIWTLTKEFPKEETYSLTNQIRRSSRSVCTNLAEAWRRIKYPAHFVSKVTDSDAENEETKVWIEFSFACKYISPETFKNWSDRSNSIGKLLGDILKQPGKYLYHHK